MRQQKNKFLGCLGYPYERLCCKLSLKVGFLVIAWWNIISAALIIVAFIVQIILMILEKDLSVFFNFSLVRNIVGLGVGISAVLGLRGLKNLDIPLLNQYYVVRLILGPIGNLLLAIDLLLNNKNEIYIALIVLFGVISVVLSFLITKVVWSVLVRINNGEVQLVTTGKVSTPPVGDSNLLESTRSIPGRPKPHFELGIH